MSKKKIIPPETTTFPERTKVNHNDELLLVNKRLAQQIEERKKRASELVIANAELAYQNEEKEKRAAELVIANTELAYQNKEKQKRADELIIANSELLFQNKEKENRAAELVIANTELAYQNQEKEDRAAELVIANTELTFQNNEKEKRAAELVIANTELAYQNQEKEDRAAELVIANTELAYQNQEKEDRAAELSIANSELLFQNKEKENRAAELVIANTELTFQNNEKEKRAAELVIANTELAYQNKEKEKRAAELVIANTELTFQNNEKEKRASELILANNELEAFTYISSHHLQEPLRKIQVFSDRISTEEYQNLTEKGKYYLERIEVSASHMQALINDLLTYSRTSVTEKKFENTSLNDVINKVLEDLKEEIKLKKAIIELSGDCKAFIIPSQFHQLICNLVSNSLKFSTKEKAPHITIETLYTKPKTKKNKSLADYCHIIISDNGIGFDPQFESRVFEMFQQLNSKTDYKGTGIGLAIVKKIVENHNGIITATGKLNHGAKFDIYIPVVS
ncbi:phospho-acceptor domain-containing protein [Flavobacterium sp. 90]|uniref:sensor histidine kinase n=1 Tax=unclassified Flavobacterium TaxID=196869 RepID=UPI000EB3CF2D|nr:MULTISPECIES: ATP-binding protein [unclassified Flavobacterium]RKR09935.1 phospho-acceptor domain-containing protein [Flavobacterium sp. 81]TCK53720.1 phospho-acceptor domain-containing protein [Flavobacterium sp. 90]